MIVSSGKVLNCTHERRTWGETTVVQVTKFSGLTSPQLSLLRVKLCHLQAEADLLHLQVVGELP